MGLEAFGAALDDWIASKEQEKKRQKGLSAVGTLEKERNASDQYQDAQKRTDQWLASLSPEDLKKVRPDTTRVSSNFEGIGDVKNFDLDKRQRQLGMTSEFSTLPEVQNYIKMNENEKKNKLNSNVTSALEEATRGMQRQKTFSDLNKLEEQAGIKPADYNLKSNREVALGAGLPRYSGNQDVKDFYKTNVEDPESMQTKLDIVEKKGSSGLGKTTEQKRDDWNKIAAMPDGPEKDQAIDDYMMIYAPGTKYTLSDKGISEASKKSGAVAAAAIEGATEPKIRQELALIEPRAKTKKSEVTAGLQATKDEGAILSETAAERLGDFGASISQMGELLNGLNNPDAPQGPIAQWKKVNPYDWQAQGKQQLVAATKQLIGKALEGGVLRKEDEEKYAKILPTMGDTYESAKLKTEQLGAMLNNAYTAKRTALKNAGYDVSNFSGGVSIQNKKPDLNKTSPSEALGKVPQQKIDLAREALNDPEAPPAVKAQARLILRNAGVQ